jgi:hypothetical protein
MRHRVLRHSFGDECSYKIVMDRICKQLLQVEKEDNRSLVRCGDDLDGRVKSLVRSKMSTHGGQEL